jgi:magnesium transporter
MRTLTSLTIALMVPTLVAGIYGMNYPLVPHVDSEWGFWFAIGTMVVLGGGGLLVFRLLRWF